MSHGGFVIDFHARRAGLSFADGPYVRVWIDSHETGARRVLFDHDAERAGACAQIDDDLAGARVERRKDRRSPDALARHGRNDPIIHPGQFAATERGDVGRVVHSS